MIQYVLRPKVIKKNWLDGYFLQDFSRQYVSYGIGGLCFGLVGLNYLPSTIFIEQYRNIFQSYRLGMARKVPDYLLNSIKKVSEKIPVAEYDCNFIRSYIVTGFDVTEIGSLKSKHCGYIGIPINYTYKNVNDIDKAKTVLNHEPIKWNSPHGKLLQESLVLKEDEIEFGLARSIMALSTWKMALDILIPPSCLLATYLLSVKLNDKYNLLKAHRALRIGLYSLTSLFGLGIYCFLTDFSQVQRDKYVDNALASVGPDFCDAGVRYYDKLLNKNIAIRELSGQDLYTAKGNVHFLLREKCLPLTVRKKYFELKLKEYQVKQEQASDIAADITEPTVQIKNQT